MFWSDQYIYQKGNDKTGKTFQYRKFRNYDEKKGKIISKTPITTERWTLPENYEWVDRTQLSSSSIISFIELVNENKGSVIKMKKKFLKYIDSQHHFFVGVQKDGKLQGLAFILIFSALIENQLHKLMHTFFLCVHPNSRKSGIAPAMIRELMRKSSQEKIYISYHQSNDSRGLNAILTKAWIKPLSEELWGKLKFPEIQFDLPQEFSNIKKAYLSEKDWIDLFSETKGYSVRLGFNSFKTFYSQRIYSTRKVLFKNKILGYIAYRKWPVKFLEANQTIEVILVDFYFGLPLGLKYFCQKWSKKYPFAYFYSIGPLTEELLIEIGAKLNDIRYINWYNWTGTYEPEKILLPLI